MSGKKFKREWRKWIFSDILWPSHRDMFSKSLQFSVRTYPRKLIDTSRIVSQAFFSSPTNRLSNVPSLKSWWIRGPSLKTPYWIIASLYLGKLRGMHLKADSVRLMDLTKFLVKPIICVWVIEWFWECLPVLDVAHIFTNIPY